MTPKLNESFIIHKLAADLGLRSSTDPVRTIVKYCNKQVRQFLSEFSDCNSPAQLLPWAANRLGTVFEEIHSDADLREITKKYVELGERIFATLPDELSGDSDGITFRRQNRRAAWDTEFVSVIDCRGRKQHRAYHTKWHELGHLLTLTDQGRLAFRRSHSSTEPKPVEEKIVDAIAGELSFYPPMITALMKGEISFEKIEAIRTSMCSEASQYSAILNLSRMWPHPCIWVEARLGYKKADAPSSQAVFSFHPPKQPTLRAKHTNANDAARDLGVGLIPNFRVPKKSVIYTAFDQNLDSAEAIEDLSWWRSSDGTQLGQCKVRVSAKRIGESIHALMVLSN